MNNHQPQQQQKMQQTGSTSGLTRYQSAPSSFFDTLFNTSSNDHAGGFGIDDDFEQLFNPRALSTDTNRAFSKLFSNYSEKTIQDQNCSSNTQIPSQSQKLPPRNSRPLIQQQQLQSSDYSMINNCGADNSQLFGIMNSSSNGVVQMKMEEQENGGGGHENCSSNLIRHSSLPAGLLLPNLDFQKELGAMRGMDNFGPGNTSNSEVSFPSPSRFKSNMGISSGHSWDDSSILSNDFLKGLVDNDNKMFANANASDNKINEGGKRPRTLLSHHLSLPTNTSAEFSAMENILQDSVTCKIRAKRGFATHPRSIAERVRRTKISERIRKLQELVPNMEKQTNTSDMLDLAADYIKDLQRQVKRLSDNGAKCSCVAKVKS